MYYTLLALFLAAAAGFALSLTSHVMTFTGGPMPFGEKVWVLHVACVVLGLATGIIHSVLTQDSQRRWWHRRTLNQWMEGAPLWLKGVGWAFSGYAVVILLRWFLTMASIDEISAPRLWNRTFSATWMALFATLGISLWVAAERVAAKQKQSTTSPGRIEPG